jgi:hypothetical protein
MKAPTETTIVLGGVLLAVLLAGQERRNEWNVGYSSTPGMVHFGIEWSKPGSHSTHSGDVPLAAFRGLNPGQSGPAKFEYVADAGTFVCQGRFSFGAGSGTYTFQPNPRFAGELQQLGYDAPRDNDQLFNMALSQVTLDFARAIRDAGLRASTDQLLELRIHGISLPYIRETQLAGYRNLTPKDYVDMKIHGVSTEFLRALKHAGYDIESRQIVELNIHGISPEYIRDLDVYGLKPQPGDLVQMKIHGIDPEFIREARDLGYRFTAADLIDLKIHGVNEAYLRNLKASGMRNLSAQQITQLKIHGVE